MAKYREQEVEVAFGPMGVLEDYDVGTLTRRIDDDQGVSLVPLTRGNLKQPKTPHVTELLRKAIEWRRQLDTGEVCNQAEIARREGITRGRVTQVTGVLRLAPEIQERIITMPETVRQPAITERSLRSITQIADQTEQSQRVQRLLDDSDDSIAVVRPAP